MEKLVRIKGKEEERRNKPKVEINVKWRRNTKESTRWIKVRKADLPRCEERGGVRGCNRKRRWEVETPLQLAGRGHNGALRRALSLSALLRGPSIANKYNIYHIIYHIMCHVSFVMCHLSCVMSHHMSSVTSHVTIISHVTYYIIYHVSCRVVSYRIVSCRVVSYIVYLTYISYRISYIIYYISYLI